MLRGIVRSFLLAEAVVGLVMTVLILLGRSDVDAFVSVLSGVGFVFIAVGFVAVWSGAKNRPSTVYAESVSQRGLQERTQDSLNEMGGRYASFIRWALVGLFIEATSILLHFAAPSIST
jgi:hypothetical protein